MKPSQNEKDAFLNDFFDAEKSASPIVGDELINAILDDAKTAQLPKSAIAPTIDGPNIWEQIANAFGGWRVAAALATCVCMGVGLGYTSSISEVIGTDYAVAGEEEFELGLSGLFDVAEL
ncbi:hypothetical protein BFP76_04255 [Amylibacter kogurei]|uniref:Dihydroorotate dehydrogenase n=1 Tax=Paramylibacter kogurei TaxID=1889778 RepID=A0A2G5K4T3_9RHOB|nr:hypothetical protein [Amylibacter kogurei]PIB24425.1 hypothetical protein BFP76_04255 [Amylibacter kogurei]